MFAREYHKLIDEVLRSPRNTSEILRSLNEQMKVAAGRGL
jgi:hypothetical protein